MDIIFQKSSLTIQQQEFIKGKEPEADRLLAASDEVLRRKGIPEEIILLLLAARKALSLEECQNVWKEELGK